VNFLKKIILAANIVLVVALLMSYLSPSTNPNENWVYAFFGVFYPLLLLANLFMMVLWMLVDFKYLFISLIAILIGWSHLTSFVNISGPAKGDMDLRVMSYNLGNGYGMRDQDVKKQRKKAKIFQNYLGGLDKLDVICLQEASHYVKTIFSHQFPDYKLVELKEKAAIMYTRYPVVDSGVVEFGTITNSCIYADLKTPSGVIRVYNTHLQSNSIGDEAADVLENEQFDESKAWSSVLNILNKYRAATKKRATQARKIKIHASTSPHPVMIVGDINDPPTSYTYNTLSEGMTDAFHKRGSGIGTTYGGSIPMLRIDYILTDPQLEILKYQCKKERFSDHYPIFGEVKVK